MEIAIPRTLPPESLVQELLAALALFQEEYHERARYLILDDALENQLVLHIGDVGAVEFTLVVPTTTPEKQEAAREGIVLPRLFFQGVPVLPSRVINRLPEAWTVGLEACPEESLSLYRETWIVHVL